MPRCARQKSVSGYMHIIVRGNGKQIIFEDDTDNLKFIYLLKKYSQETNTEINAFCLMTNHVHLLVNDTSEQVSSFMKKLGISYSAYFNHKYERTGHLFQDRYLSENVDNEKYLLTVFRYILKNPEKAGMCSAKNYRWSSYHSYGRTDSFIETGTLEELIGDKTEYERFISTASDDICMEYESKRHSDISAAEIIKAITGEKSGTILQTFVKEDRNRVLHSLKLQGLSIRQLERLTGISRGIIQNA